jgi:hypothetical protein
MARSVKVTLGGRDYQVDELRSRENAAWRERLRVPFANLVQRLEEAGDTEITNPGAMVALLRDTAGTVITAPDLLAELLFTYSTVLAADQERIVAEAYDSELMNGFIEVLKLAYPFGALAQKIGGLIQRGRATQPITVK